MSEITCERCGTILKVGDFPFCGPKGGHEPQSTGVIGDDIPGGVEIRHGLCNEDGSPRRYYSKSEMAKEAKKRGLVNQVEHVVDPKSGSDKSKVTTRWY